MRTAELQAGRIDHALAFAIPHTKLWKSWSWPAQRSDGDTDSADAIPEGARFRLPADLDIDALRLPPVTAAIAKAVQRYGMVLRDKSGAVSFYAEAPTGADPYPRSSRPTRTCCSRSSPGIACRRSAPTCAARSPGAEKRVIARPPRRRGRPCAPAHGGAAAARAGAPPRAAGRAAPVAGRARRRRGRPPPAARGRGPSRAGPRTGRAGRRCTSALRVGVEDLGVGGLHGDAVGRDLALVQVVHRGDRGRHDARAALEHPQPQVEVGAALQRRVEPARGEGRVAVQQGRARRHAVLGERDGGGRAQDARPRARGRRRACAAAPSASTPAHVPATRTRPVWSGQIVSRWCGSHSSSESSSATHGCVASRRPVLRAPPSPRLTSWRITRAPSCGRDCAGVVGGAVVDDDHLGRSRASGAPRSRGLGGPSPGGCSAGTTTATGSDSRTSRDAAIAAFCWPMRRSRSAAAERTRPWAARRRGVHRAGQPGPEQAPQPRAPGEPDERRAHGREPGGERVRRERPTTSPCSAWMRQRPTPDVCASRRRAANERR